ncbi:MAG: flagellar hook-associated protein FlgK [Vicinamibacterales bacterium]
MAGLFGQLSMAARSLEAQTAGLDVTGQNMANLNTPGYARRRLGLAEVVYGAKGVEVTGTRALRDRVLDARVRAAIPDETREGALLDALSLVETNIGAPGQGIDARLSAFFDSMSALSVDPTSATARDGVVLEAGRLTASFNDVARRLTDSGRAADNGVRESVNEVNALAAKIAKINEQIGSGGGGLDIEGLKDQQTLAIEELSTLTAVSVLARKDGGVDVTIPSGRALVIGASNYDVHVGTGANGYATLTLGTANVTGEFTTGRIGGLSYARDTLIPGYQARLDELAYGVAQEVNALHQTGFDLSGAAGGDFFTPPAAVAGAAAGLSVSAAVKADPSLIAASQTGAPGDNGIARALADLRDKKTLLGGSATFTEGWAQLAYHVGSDVDAARAEQQAKHTVAQEVGRLRDQVSGVSLDEEAASMLKFQRAYEANAKYFTAVDDTLQVLMGLVRA